MKNDARAIRSEYVALGAVVADGRSPSSMNLTRSAFTGVRADLWEHLEQRERDGIPWDDVSIVRTADLRPEFIEAVRDASAESNIAPLHLEQHAEHLRRLGWRRDVARAAHKLCKAFEAGEDIDVHVRAVGRLAEVRS